MVIPLLQNLYNKKITVFFVAEKYARKTRKNFFFKLKLGAAKTTQIKT